jgi:membrane associated rhomboid family serine protease
LINWSLIAPTIEAALGSLSFAWLLAVISVLNGCVYTLLTIIASALSNDAEYYWHNCAIGFSGTVLSLMVIWVYTFASSSRIQLGPAVELPLTVLPPVLFLVSMLLPSASVWCHLTGLVVGMLYVAGALNWLQLSRDRSRSLEKFALLRLIVTRQGFVSVDSDILPTTNEPEQAKSRRQSSQIALDVPERDSVAMKSTIQLH